jgi:predicted transcriptional regulator
MKTKILKTSKINIRIDEDLHDEVRQLAKVKHNTISGIVCSLLEQYVEDNKHLLP